MNSLISHVSKTAGSGQSASRSHSIAIRATFFQVFLVAVMLNYVTPVTLGQEADMNNPAERIESYLTQTSVAILCLDLHRLEVEAHQELLNQLSKLVPQLPLLSNGFPAPTETNGQVDELFIIFDFIGSPEQFAFAVFLPSKEKRLLELNNANLKGTMESRLIGPPVLLDHLKTKPPGSERPYLKRAFSRYQGATIQFVIAPTADQQRVLREMLPDLSGDLGDAQGVDLADGFLYLAGGMNDLNSLEISLETSSEKSAEAWKQAIAGLLGRIAKNEALLAKVPDAAALAASLVPQQKGSQLTISRDQTSKISASILQHFQEVITADARRRESANNLKHLGLAFHNFHDKYQSFPPAASFDADGKPLLSWRVFLLPALGEQKLYEQFRLNEPWDSEHNKALVDKMPEIFQSPRTPALPGHTVFQVITGEKTLFAGKSGKGMPDIKDGTSNTVLVVETIAERAVPWTKPADPELDPAAPNTGLVEGRDGFWTTFCDGSARFISKDVAPETLLKLFMPADGQVIGEF